MMKITHLFRYVLGIGFAGLMLLTSVNSAMAGQTVVSPVTGWTLQALTSGTGDSTITTFTVALADGDKANAFTAGGRTYSLAAISQFLLYDSSTDSPISGLSAGPNGGYVGSTYTSAGAWDWKANGTASAKNSGPGYIATGGNNGFNGKRNLLIANNAPEWSGGPNSGVVWSNMATFEFQGALPASYNISLDVYTPGNNNLFDNTGTITFAAPTVITYDLNPAPEPSSVAAFAFTGIGVLGLMLRARKRRSMTA